MRVMSNMTMWTKSKDLKIEATSASLRQPASTGLIRLKSANRSQHGTDAREESREKQTPLQRYSTNRSRSSEIPAVVDEVLHSPGHPLDTGTRAFMESRFGHDFSQVRVHTSAKAAESAQQVNAIAYTVGDDIVFGASQYKPDTPAGRRLLAHELVHSIQQAGASRGTFRVDAPGDVYEREAESLSSAVDRGRTSSKPSLTSWLALLRKASIEEEIAWERVHPAGKVESTFDRGHALITLWNFAVGHATLKPEHTDALTRIAAAFRGETTDFIVIEGYTSSSGDVHRNQTLSERRAKAAKAYLVAEGVFGKQIAADGLGASDPRIPNSTAENLAKNRRVMIRGAVLT